MCTKSSVCLSTCLCRPNTLQAAPRCRGSRTTGNTQVEMGRTSLLRMYHAASKYKSPLQYLLVHANRVSWLLLHCTVLQTASALTSLSYHTHTTHRHYTLTDARTHTHTHTHTHRRKQVISLIIDHHTCVHKLHLPGSGFLHIRALQAAHAGCRGKWVQKKGGIYR